MNSLVRLAVTLMLEIGFWTLLVLAPIALLLLGHWLLAVGAVAAAFAARALGGRPRLAHVVVCLLMLAAAGYHVWNASRTSGNTRVLSSSRAAAYAVLIALVARSRP